MREILDAPHPAEQGRTAPKSPPLGHELGDLIAARDHGRPVLRIADSAAPRLGDIIPDRTVDSVRAALRSDHARAALSPDVRRAARDAWQPTGVRRRVLSWLDLGGGGLAGDALWGDLSERDKKHLAFLAAAVRYDIWLYTEKRTGEGLGYKNPLDVKEPIRRGRELWAHLPAWPWSLFGPDGKPPDDWRREGPTGEVADALAAWLAG